MNFRTFTTLDEMIEAMQGDQREADAAVVGRSETFEPGSYYLRLIPEANLVVYGEILDPVQATLEAGGDEEEMEWEREARAQPHMKNYRFTRSYSQACPRGELGDVHVASMHLALTKEEFEKARRIGWPGPVMAVREVLGHRLKGGRHE